MLQQMDGIGSGSEGGLVMVLATTNKPWDLDDALRRRLEKRIYIPLPDLEAREAAFELHLKDSTLGEDVEFSELARQTDSYSGSDIRLVCREAAMVGCRNHDKWINMLVLVRCL